MQELEWLSLHPKEVEKYSGKWIALTNKGIVAAGDSVREVTSILREKGIKAMVMKVPRKDEEMLVSA